MRSAAWGLGALGLACVLLTGCTALDFDLNVLTTNWGSPGGDRVISGSLDTVAESTRASLERVGLAATISRQGETVYIASMSRTGAKFTFVLTRETGKDGEQTRIRVNWEKGSDEQTVFQVLSGIEISRK